MINNAFFQEYSVDSVATFTDAKDVTSVDIIVHRSTPEPVDGTPSQFQLDVRICQGMDVLGVFGSVIDFLVQ